MPENHHNHEHSAVPKHSSVMQFLKRVDVPKLPVFFSTSLAAVLLFITVVAGGSGSKPFKPLTLQYNQTLAASKIKCQSKNKPKPTASFRTRQKWEKDCGKVLLAPTSKKSSSSISEDAQTPGDSGTQAWAESSSATSSGSGGQSTRVSDLPRDGQSPSRGAVTQNAGCGYYFQDSSGYYPVLPDENCNPDPPAPLPLQYPPELMGVNTQFVAHEVGYDDWYNGVVGGGHVILYGNFPMRPEVGEYRVFLNGRNIGLMYPLSEHQVNTEQLNIFGYDCIYGYVTVSIENDYGGSSATANCY